MSERARTFFIGCGIAAALSACGGGDGGGSGGPPRQDDGGAAGTGAVASTGGAGPSLGGAPAAGGAAGAPAAGGAGNVGGAQPPTGLDLTGMWAGKQVSTQNVMAPIVGPQVQVSETLSLTELVQADGMLSATSKICSMSFSPVAGTSTIWPPASIDAMPVTTVQAPVGSVAVGSSYSMPPTAGLLGWDSPNPTTDALPASPTDPRVTDPDHDGHPGVTIQIQGLVSGDVFVVARTTVAMNATILSQDRIEGSHTTSSEQAVIEASNPLLKQNIPATPDPDPAKNPVTLVRLPDPSPTCADVVARAPMLFP